MNSDIKKWADWAASQGWTVKATADGYTQFFNPEGEYVGRYPATPSNPRRRMADLKGALTKAGLPIPPPSKKEQHSVRRRREGN